MADFQIADYLARSGAGESSLRTYRKLLTRCEALLEKPLSRATARDLESLKTRLRKLRSGKNYAAELRRFYRAAGQEDLAKLCVIKQRAHRLQPQDILTLPEVNAMIAAANSLRDRALIVILWATGERVSAVGKLRCGDLDEKASDNGGGGIRVTFRFVKIAGQEHVSWVLDKEGAGHVRAWVNGMGSLHGADRPLFPSRTVGQGRSLNESAILKIIQATAKRAGIQKRVFPHLFRHSRATFLMRKGVPDSQIEKQCGWAPGSGMLSRRYGHLAAEDAYDALLRAQGIPVPEKEDLGELIPTEGGLKPVVPMMPKPGEEPVGFTLEEIMEIKAALKLVPILDSGRSVEELLMEGKTTIGQLVAREVRKAVEEVMRDKDKFKPAK